jgi:formylglycine-generating enzyme required for sulfatase activity
VKHGYRQCAIATISLLSTIACQRGSQCTSLDWVAIPGGAFEMGAADIDCLGKWYRENLFCQAQVPCNAPVHGVLVSPFDMTRTEATVCQYYACVESGACTQPIVSQTEIDRPIACIDWQQARAFCIWAGGRLCTDAEWEYAARNGANNDDYPWGDASPTHDLAIFGHEPDFPMCLGDSIAPVCSRPKGNNAWGICDLSGNVEEWVEDDPHGDYLGAPGDASAWIHDPRSVFRVYRGGTAFSDASNLRAAAADALPVGAIGNASGIRCCRFPPVQGPERQ